MFQKKNFFLSLLLQRRAMVIARWIEGRRSEVKVNPKIFTTKTDQNNFRPFRISSAFQLRRKIVSTYICTYLNQREMREKSLRRMWHVLRNEDDLKTVSVGILLTPLNLKNVFFVGCRTFLPCDPRTDLNVWKFASQTSSFPPYPKSRSSLGRFRSLSSLA